MQLLYLSNLPAVCVSLIKEKRQHTYQKEILRRVLIEMLLP